MESDNALRVDSVGGTVRLTASRDESGTSFDQDVMSPTTQAWASSRSQSNDPEIVAAVSSPPLGDRQRGPTIRPARRSTSPAGSAAPYSRVAVPPVTRGSNPLRSRTSSGSQDTCRHQADGGWRTIRPVRRQGHAYVEGTRCRSGASG